MSKYLKKQQQLIQAATESNTVLLGTPATLPVLPHHPGPNKPNNTRRSAKGKHPSRASAG